MRTKELYPLLFTVACLIFSSTACKCKHRLHNCQKELEGSKHSLLVIKKELEDKSRKSEADLKQTEQKLMDKVNLLSVCTSELTEAKAAQTQYLRDLESEKSKSKMMAEKSEELLKQLREELQSKKERLSVLHAELDSCNTKYVLFWITIGVIAVVVLYPNVVSLANGEQLSKKKFD